MQNRTADVAAKALLVAGAVLSLTPIATPALALGAGIIIALTIGNPWRSFTAASSSHLLQASVVGLGFGIPLNALLRAGLSGIGVTALTIAAVFALGLTLAKWMRVERTIGVLITAGTSICGGSAIAAIGPAIGAGAEAMGVSLATVFVFNAVALYVFPVVAHLAGLSQHQFGLWAALAIHDTSSVVGAASHYGPIALRDATILKLARALWILPLTLILPAALQAKSGGARRVQVPWFIGLFMLAAVARALAPDAMLPTFDAVSSWARIALVLTLYLIGSNLTRDQLRTVGIPPLVLGVVLWLVVSAVTLGAVMSFAS